jgi:hypothetical protein
LSIADYRLGWLSLVVLLGLWTAGCDTGSTASDVAPQADGAFGRGVVSGVVAFGGTPPPVAMIPNDTCHNQGARPLPDETVVVNEGGKTLRNVIVYLDGVSGRYDGTQAPAAVLDQVDCRYVPHVLAVQAGQTLLVKSSDPTLHNVHYRPAENPAGNFGLTQAGSDRRVTFARSEPEPVRVKCDVHPWMTAYVGVLPHPFFAVTGDHGRFEISRVPPGSYTLVAWHERYGRLTRPITVGEDGKVEAALEYKAPE